ncbi:hypothetical protein HA402_007684 [Bradysia odoriphaga]|nr:hypothetical protein HA402_007684 [Bradysia odoriphaga]
MEFEKSQTLWNTLYSLHWDYIETEENSTELLLKKDKLKSCIQNFLSITPPDRIFYLPQTKDVLRGSVQKLKQFAAYEASIAFDAIAQYANNLLTKPWRTEYKIIKTHSGFYQHKIKSQLVDVDELFIAMGYVKSQNQTLLFDGPICQDQLANVSRDCMIACEECLIMHRLYYGLQDNKMNVTWTDVYKFRESYLGDEHQSSAGVQQKKYKDKMVTPDHFISQVPHQRCNCNVVNTMHNPQCTPCQYNNYQPIANSECINHHPPINHVNCFQPHYDHISHLPHSRSMDQYTGHVPISHGFFRHSLDHSIANDTVDGHQRYAKQFVPYNHTMYPPAAIASNFYNNHLNHCDGNEYASISAVNRPQAGANFTSSRISPRSYDQPAKYDDHSGMSYYPPIRNCEEDLIKFEDSQKMTTKADRNYGHPDLSYEFNNAQYTDQLRKADSQFNRPVQAISYANTLKQNQHFDSKPIEQKLRHMELSNGGIKPPKELRDVDKSLDRKELRSNEQRRIKNNQILAGYEIDDQVSRDSRASDFDSTDYAYDEDNAKASRNKDGQGSMEEWSYVYNGIKKNSQNNGTAFQEGFNGHDKGNGTKSLVKKTKEPQSDTTAVKSVMKESKTKANRIRPANINIDEHDLHKNSTKKPQKNGRTVNKSPVIVNEWNCEHCTFINTGSANICSMCSKSKNFHDRPSSKSTATPV